MGTSFPEIVTVGLGVATSLFCRHRPTVGEDRLIAHKLGVNPSIARLVICPCGQLPGSATIS